MAFWVAAACASGQQAVEGLQAWPEKPESSIPGKPGTSGQAEPETSGEEEPEDLDTQVPVFVAMEDSLKKLALRIIEPMEDSARLDNNRQFHEELVRVLKKSGSFRHPFDSLQTVSMLTAPDSAFRIITWYVPLRGQRFEYFGIIQMAPPNERTDGSNGSGNRGSNGNGNGDVGFGSNGGSDHNGKPLLIHLHDSTAVISSTVFSAHSHDRWFGAYYYDLIHERSGETDLYTLLGWKGDNPHTRMRVIEPLWFRDGQPVFGRQVFRIGQREPYRIVFEYSAMSAMSLVYATHPVRPGQPAREMIVFDRLSPGDDSLRGHYRFYFPEANILDALVFEEGRWVFYPDVDARAPAPPPAEE